MLDILDTVEQWLKAGQKVALATVVETWGSSPRQAGAKMAVTADMAMIGSVSGGCVETAVVQEALDILSDGKSRLLDYGVSDDTAWNVGLACGGKMAVYVEPLDRSWWEHAIECVRQHRLFSTVTVLGGSGQGAGHKLLLDHDHDVTYATKDMPLDLKDILRAQARSAEHNSETKSQRKQITVADRTYDLLIDVYHPQPRLVIIGGAHVAMALATFARQLGWRVVLIDPREVFATPERFPDADQIIHTYPDKALATLGLDPETYIAVLTHDPKIDDPALRVALPSSAPYIGVLSSKRAHQQRIERLSKAGMDPRLLDRVYTPIGLDIGAKTPEEIGLCIMAEIVAVRNGAREKTKPAVKAATGASS